MRLENIRSKEREMLGAWLSTPSGTCGKCGGLYPGFVVVEKEVYEESVLPEMGACKCAWLAALRAELERCFAPSRTEVLMKFRAIVRKHGLDIE